jgi:hypothetical protein
MNNGFPSDQSQSGGLPIAHSNGGGEESKNEFTFGGDGGSGDLDISLHELDMCMYDLLSPVEQVEIDLKYLNLESSAPSGNVPALFDGDSAPGFGAPPNLTYDYGSWYPGCSPSQ